MRFLVIPVLAILLLSIPAFGEGDDARGRIKRDASQKLFEKQGDDIVERLIKAGLSEADAQSAARRFSDDTVECVLIAVEEAIVSRGDSPSGHFRDARAEDLAKLFGDTEGWERALMHCLTTAYSNAGLNTS